ncbi:UNVERIFIED_CONTAM: hypothetical protein HDU68_011251 [Siphonaria sp. JEL0065]|nr:hypothetical protein HDU68_011251 [Siphonaria sp. JEL0065]
MSFPRSAGFEDGGGANGYGMGSTFSMTSTDLPLTSSSSTISKISPYSSADAMKRLETRWSLNPSTPSTTVSRYSEDFYAPQTPSSPFRFGARNGRASIYSGKLSMRPPPSPLGRKSVAAVSPGGTGGGGGIFSSYIQQDSEITLFDELQADEGRQLQLRRVGGSGQNETWGWRFIIDLAANSVPGAVFIAVWYEVLAGRGPVNGCIIGVLVTFCVVVLLQVGIGVFNPDYISETYRPFLSRKTSIPLSIGYISIAISATLSNPFGFMVIASLWPLCFMLCFSSTGRCTTEDRMVPLLESILSGDKIVRLRKQEMSRKEGKSSREENAVSKIASPFVVNRRKIGAEISVPAGSTGSGDPALSPTVKRFLQSMAKSFIAHLFLVSIFCGLQLPVAITVCMFSILYSTGAANRVGKRNSSFVGQVTFWVVGVVSLAVLSAVAMLPLYAFPFGSGFISEGTSDKVDVLYLITDMFVGVGDVERAVAAVALKGFYMAVNVNSTLMGGSLGVILNSIKNNGGNLMIETDSNLQQVIDISKVSFVLSFYNPF